MKNKVVNEEKCLNALKEAKDGEKLLFNNPQEERGWLTKAIIEKISKRNTAKKEKEIELLKLDIELEKLKKELKRVKGGKK